MEGQSEYIKHEETSTTCKPPVRGTDEQTPSDHGQLYLWIFGHVVQSMIEFSNILRTACKITEM